MRDFMTLAGQAMAESFWATALVAAVAGLALRLFTSPAKRHALAVAGLAGSALPFVWSFIPRETGPSFSKTIMPAPEWMPLLGAAWMIAAALLSLRVFGGCVSLQRQIRRAVPAALPQWSGWCERVGVDAQLRISATVDSAFAAGVWRQVVVLPASWMAALPADQLEAILLHELAHLRRHDYALEILQRFIEALCCFHPAVWWLSSVARAEREKACDDAAVAAGAQRQVLAKALLELEEARTFAPAATGSALGVRVRRLLGAPAPRRSSLMPALMLAGVVALGLLAQGPQVSEPYKKWLSEDVVWIIEPREKAAFQSLKTDEECQKFIEQFWSVRPAKAKEEHYRRIQWVNQRYQQGWKTEQGRTYIRFGPPDEIEQHPERKKEAWLYRDLPGVGTNVIFNFGTPPGK